MKICLTLLASLLAAIAHPALAERTDRDKPIQLEGERITIDDAKKIQTLEGDVVLIQGTLMIQSDKIVVTEDQYGFQKGTAFGGKNGLARFRQKRDGKDEYIEGEGERIEYNTHNEVAELFRRAWVKSGEDEVRGDYIRYDGMTEKYLATAGEARNPKEPPPRVRAIIQPKKKEAPSPEAPAGKGERLQLKEADELGGKPQRER